MQARCLNRREWHSWHSRSRRSAFYSNLSVKKVTEPVHMWFRDKERASEEEFPKPRFPAGTSVRYSEFEQCSLASFLTFSVLHRQNKTKRQVDAKNKRNPTGCFPRRVPSCLGSAWLLESGMPAQPGLRGIFPEQVLNLHAACLCTPGTRFISVTRHNGIPNPSDVINPISQTS